jgi:uncharacterized protein (DUF697 family)
MATEAVVTKTSESSAKADLKADLKADPKTAPKPEAKAETKAEPTPEVKAEPATEGQKGEPATSPNDALPRVGRAQAIIRRNVLWSLVAGVLPVPIVDLIAVEGVQLKMLKELADLYDMKFTDKLARTLISSLVATTWSVGMGSALAYGFVKFIPVVGTALGMIATPLAAAACTHAVGNVFMMHFEAGGTLLNFDPHAMRSHFISEFEKAKDVVARMQQEKT